MTLKTNRYEPQQVPGKGWTVVKAIGSKRIGRTTERAPGFEKIESYTLAQAQSAAAAVSRDAARFGPSEITA